MFNHQNAISLMPMFALWLDTRLKRYRSVNKSRKKFPVVNQNIFLIIQMDGGMEGDRKYHQLI